MAKQVDPIVPNTEVTPEIPTVISINGVDYDPAEAQSLIDLGSKTRDLEKQWDTPVDKVWPEFGKSRETLKSLEGQLADAQTKIQEYEAKKDAGTETPADTKAAREAAKQLGIVLDEDLDSRGYIKKDELPQLFQSWSQEQEAIKGVLATADSLEKEIDGTDGRPAFNKKVVLAYATAYNIPDLKAAYEDMNKPQLDAWKSKQVTDKRNLGLKTLEGGGSKETKKVEVNDDNKRDLLREALWGSNEE